MSAAPAALTGAPAVRGRFLLAVAVLSAGLIAYEIVLMRRLLVESWHHFGFLVISAALLGFGTSGTLLALLQRRVRERPARTLAWSAAGLAAALIVLPRAAALLPVSARFIPGDLWGQAGWWSAYWLTALVPFLLGATFIGTALMIAGPAVGRTYAANLVGSGVGAVGAVLLLSRVALPHTLWPTLALTLIALLLVPGATRRDGLKRGVLALLLLVAGVAAELSWPLRPDYDEHKYAAHLQELVAQGSAQRVATAADPHGSVALYASDLFHDLPFVALHATPPPMFSLVINGDPAGSVLRIDDVAEAAVMDGTLMAVPYRLLSSTPRVLLLGETGGANVWLARRQQAAQIDVVQPNAALVSLLRSHAPALFAADTTFHTSDPRWFLRTHPQQRYDLIQVASLEGLGVAGGGVRGLAEDHLVTVEGLAACLRALNEQGILAVSRGIQQPPRENIRLLATMTAALESLGVDEPARHIVQVRDYLGVCTMALRAPLGDDRRQRLQQTIMEFNLTPVWYTDIAPAAVNRPDALPGPADSEVDWLHHAAAQIFSPARQAFYERWLLDVRPPSDDRPFFWDFYKPAALPVLQRAYGDLWLTRAEIGRLFLYASIVIAATAAAVFILVPLAAAELWRRWRRPPVTPLRQAPAAGPLLALWTVLYFGAIGLGFMGIEMALISRAIHWLGDPVIASAVVIGAVLVLSGLGSAISERVARGRVWYAPAVVVAAAILLRFLGWPVAAALGPWPLVAGSVVVAVLMGMPMPTGLAALHARAPRLVPWAWGINGVASVIATSSAIALAMSAGYAAVLLVAGGLYVVAAAVGGTALGRRDRG